MFSPDQLKQYLPYDAKPGEKIVVGTVDLHGVQVVVDLKLNTNWEVQGVYHHDWGGGLAKSPSLADGRKV